MNALIIGGDYIDQIRKAVNDSGMEQVHHWPGRKVGELRKAVPDGTGLVVVLCDFVSHPMVKRIRDEASRLGIPVLYCRRTVADVRDKLARWSMQQGRELRMAG